MQYSETIWVCVVLDYVWHLFGFLFTLTHDCICLHGVTQSLTSWWCQSVSHRWQQSYGQSFQTRHRALCVPVNHPVSSPELWKHCLGHTLWQAVQLGHMQSKAIIIARHSSGLSQDASAARVTLIAVWYAKWILIYGLPQVPVTTQAVGSSAPASCTSEQYTGQDAYMYKHIAPESHQVP